MGYTENAGKIKDDEKPTLPSYDKTTDEGNYS